MIVEAKELSRSLYLENENFTDNSKFYARILFISDKKQEAALIEMNKTEAAINVLNNALSTSPDDPVLLMLLAKYEMKNSDCVKTSTLLKISELLHSQQVEIPIELAKLYQEYGLVGEFQK